MCNAMGRILYLKQGLTNERRRCCRHHESVDSGLKPIQETREDGFIINNQGSTSYRSDGIQVAYNQDRNTFAYTAPFVN